MYHLRDTPEAILTTTTQGPRSSVWEWAVGRRHLWLGLGVALAEQGIVFDGCVCVGGENGCRHGRAAEIAGPTMIADDLVLAIPRALAEGR